MEMPDFYADCLESLEALAGIKQYKFLQMGRADEFKKQCELLVKGMVYASHKFPSIPLERQQVIIKKMIVEDTTYDSLNARTIMKWLSAYQDRRASIVQEQEPEQPTVEVSPEEQAKTRKMVQDFIESLRRVPTTRWKEVEAEKRKIMREEEERINGRKAFSVGHHTDPEVIVNMKIHNAWMRECINDDGTLRHGAKPEEEWVAEKTEDEIKRLLQ